MKNIVIVGAGYAGVLTAKKLAKRLRKAQVQITLIDKNPFHTLFTELHEVAAQRVEEDAVRVSLARVFAGRGVRLALDTISAVDFDAKTVTGAAAVYPYDFLVLATGSRPTFFGVAGAAEHAHTLWSYNDAVSLREQIPERFRRAARERDETERRRLLSFFVVGAGFTGVEMTGELAELLPLLCEQYEIDRADVSLCEVDMLDRVVPILPPKLSEKVTRRLSRQGVRLLLGRDVAEIGQEFIDLRENGKVSRYPAGLVIWTAGIESDAPAYLQPPRTERRGRLVTDRWLRLLDRPEVFVAGDNICYTPAGAREPVPQMVENCEQSAALIARNLAAAVTGTDELREYRPQFHGVMVSVGGRYGVARVGFPEHMWSLPSFPAMFVKHFINIVYFAQLLGWNKIFSYLRHEFFTVRNCRSFVGGHLSNRTPSFLLVPLRVWLGACWLFEGVLKIAEGWLTTPMLTAFFGGANQFFTQILTAAGAQSPAVIDAVASATSAGGEAVSGVALFSVRLLGLVNVMLVSGVELAHATLADYAFKLDIPLLNSLLDTVLLSSDGMQLIAQIGVVGAEIALGLCLIGGLFTLPAAGVSLVMQGMFVCTTGLYLNTFWMIFAGIAVLVGGGRSFGLDYYVMPWLKARWKRLRTVRKGYLYHD